MEFTHLHHFIPRSTCDWISNVILNIPSDDASVERSKIRMLLHKHLKRSTKYNNDKNTYVIRDSGYTLDILNNSDSGKTVSPVASLVTTSTQVGQYCNYTPFLTFIAVFSGEVEITAPFQNHTITMKPCDVLLLPRNWFYPFSMLSTSKTHKVCYASVDLFAQGDSEVHPLHNSILHAYNKPSLGLGQALQAHRYGCIVHFKNVLPDGLCDEACRFISNVSKTIRITTYDKGENTITKNISAGKFKPSDPDYATAHSIDKQMHEVLNIVVSAISDLFKELAPWHSSFINNVFCDSGYTFRVIEGATRRHCDGPNMGYGLNGELCYRLGTFIGGFSESSDTIAFPCQEVTLHIGKGDVIFFPPYVPFEHMTTFNKRSTRFVTWLMVKPSSGEMLSSDAFNCD
jgi:hypothetical protein